MSTDLTGSTALVTGGHIDVLVNNAGMFPFGPTESHTEADFDSVYALNVKVPFFLVAEIAPAMAARGKGSIINLTTMVAQFGQAGMALYSSSKAALTLLTKAWAAEYGPSGVRVNAVSPGPTRTEGTVVMGDALDQQAAAAPQGCPKTSPTASPTWRVMTPTMSTARSCPSARKKQPLICLCKSTTVLWCPR